MPDNARGGASQGPTRRSVVQRAALGGLALPLLASCGAPSNASGPGASGRGGAGDATVAAADVPVGGGVVLTQAQVVVTQPSRGDFKAFSAVCTHMGCLVDAVRDRQIVCPCHGSHYSIADGSVVSGPAPSPLPARKVSVQGGRVRVS